MDGYQYEEKCAELLKAKGFSDVQVTPGSGDQGIDVIAYQSKKKYGVQCKYYEGTVGNKAIQEVFAGAAYYNCDVALVITNSTLTKPAKELASKLKVEIWENIDAIYLQKHTAEYIEQQRALRQREREQQQQLERQRRQEERLKQELALKEKAEAAKLAKKKEESGEFDLKRQYIQYAKGLLGISQFVFAYVTPEGKVVSYDKYGKVTSVDMPQFHNIQSVVCTNDNIVGLRYDGSCTVIPKSPIPVGTRIVSEYDRWRNIIAIAAGNHHVIGLKNDGTCVAYSTKWDPGDGHNSPTNVSKWRNIVQVECDGDSTLGLQSDGRVVFAGKCTDSFAERIASWSDIKMIGNGFGDMVVALTKEGKVINSAGISTTKIKPEKGILQLKVFRANTYALYDDGSVDCCGIISCPSVKENNIISLFVYPHILCALDKSGQVHVYCQILGTFKIPTDLRIFDNYDQALNRHNKMMEEFAIRGKRKAQGVCQFCGGTFKGFFVQKCSKCGKRKDY